MRDQWRDLRLKQSIAVKDQAKLSSQGAVSPVNGSWAASTVRPPITMSRLFPIGSRTGSIRSSGAVPVVTNLDSSTASGGRSPMTADNGTCLTGAGRCGLPNPLNDHSWGETNSDQWTLASEPSSDTSSRYMSPKV